ncbi:MAG: hypothetical protein HPY71_13570 [Firmicutes bacterium]|nr:hypothetical protein [Bacillota bacterium]
MDNNFEGKRFIMDGLPKNVKIGGEVFEVVEAEAALDPRAFGEMDYKKARLVIDKDLKPAAKMSVLLHEILEAINYMNQLNLEHRTIMTLEHDLYQVLHDNQLCF